MSVFPLLEYLFSLHGNISPGGLLDRSIRSTFEDSSSSSYSTSTPAVESEKRDAIPDQEIAGHIVLNSADGPMPEKLSNSVGFHQSNHSSDEKKMKNSPILNCADDDSDGKQLHEMFALSNMSDHGPSSSEPMETSIGTRNRGRSVRAFDFFSFVASCKRISSVMCTRENCLLYQLSCCFLWRLLGSYFVQMPATENVLAKNLNAPMAHYRIVEGRVVEEDLSLVSGSGSVGETGTRTGTGTSSDSPAVRRMLTDSSMSPAPLIETQAPTTPSSTASNERTEQEELIEEAYFSPSTLAAQRKAASKAPGRNLPPSQCISSASTGTFLLEGKLISSKYNAYIFAVSDFCNWMLDLFKIVFKFEKFRSECDSLRVYICTTISFRFFSLDSFLPSDDFQMVRSSSRCLRD